MRCERTRVSPGEEQRAGTHSLTRKHREQGALTMRLEGS